MLFNDLIKTDGVKPHCSFCDSTDVELVAPFGTAQLVRQYYCNHCKVTFEYIRWQEKEVGQHEE